MLFASNTDMLVARDAGEQLRIEAWGTDALRVRSTCNASFSEANGGLLPANSSARVAIEEHGAVIQNGRVSAQLDKRGWLEFFRDGKSVLKE